LPSPLRKFPRLTPLLKNPNKKTTKMLLKNLSKMLTRTNSLRKLKKKTLRKLLKRILRLRNFPRRKKRRRNPLLNSRSLKKALRPGGPLPGRDVTRPKVVEFLLPSGKNVPGLSPRSANS